LRWTFILLLVSPYFVDVAWQKITTMRFNFLKLLDRILLHLFRRDNVVSDDITITSSLRSDVIIRNKFSVI